MAMDPRVIHLLQSFQSTRLAAVGSATVLLYDHLITIDQEIDLVWRKDWSFLKGVFIFHRYLGLTCVLVELYAILSPNVTQAVRTFWFRWEMWGYTVVVLTSELVLLLWIFVIYNRDLRVLAVLGALFVAELVSTTVILAESFARLEIVPNILQLPGQNFCSLRNQPQFFYWYWLPILVYNSAILALFIFKGTDAFRVTNIPNIARMHKLYRRSFVNFLSIFVVYMVCCILWIAGDFSLGQIPVGFVLAFSITNSTRLLINIRHAYYSREEVDLERPVVKAIYANQAPPEEWLFELRALKLG
ncbi:hypothetical protein B0H19DRAFT_289572 [Mycena capillaripes]|nr:hypothetical protein B0H19DRAFT_289572 [Mycena capillaripes]